MDSKIRIKSGEVEIEFQGSESFIKSDLLQFAKDAVQALSDSTFQGKDENSSDNSSSNKASANSNSVASGKLDMSTAAIMSKMNGNGGPDLALAAAAYLTFVGGKATFSRSELLTEMKTATAYYTETMSNNFSKTLERLGKDSKFVQKSNKNYAIQNATHKQLEAQLLAD